MVNWGTWGLDEDAVWISIRVEAPRISMSARVIVLLMSCHYMKPWVGFCIKGFLYRFLDKA